MADLASHSADAFSPRQTAVLECALRLLVEGGEKALTTAGIARAANCSKESLYKWFGDRNGILEAIVTFQAAKVRTPAAGPQMIAKAAIRDALTIFAADLLTVLAGDVSLALNRLAIGQAGHDDGSLGQIILERGRRTIEQRALGLLEKGRAQRFFQFETTQSAYETLYGLIVRDVHVRLLLGGKVKPEDFPARAARAIDQFFRLFETEK